MTHLKAGQSAPMNIRRKPTTDGPGTLLLTLLVTMLTDGVSLIFAGNQILNRALPEAEARAYLEFLKAEAAAGTPLWLIERRAGYFTSAMAVADQAEQDMVEQLTADLTATAAEAKTEADQLTADAQQIVADGRGLQSYRQSCTRRAANTSEPLDRVLAQAVDGYIRRGKTASIRQLIALEQMGLVELDRRREGRHWVTYGATLTAKAERRVAAA